MSRPMLILCSLFLGACGEAANGDPIDHRDNPATNNLPDDPNTPPVDSSCQDFKATVRNEATGQTRCAPVCVTHEDCTGVNSYCVSSTVDESSNGANFCGTPEPLAVTQLGMLANAAGFDLVFDRDNDMHLFTVLEPHSYTYTVASAQGVKKNELTYNILAGFDFSFPQHLKATVYNGQIGLTHMTFEGETYSDGTVAGAHDVSHTNFATGDFKLIQATNLARLSFNDSGRLGTGLDDFDTVVDADQNPIHVWQRVYTDQICWHRTSDDDGWCRTLPETHNFAMKLRALPVGEQVFIPYVSEAKSLRVIIGNHDGTSQDGALLASQDTRNVVSFSIAGSFDSIVMYVTYETGPGNICVFESNSWSCEEASTTFGQDRHVHDLSYSSTMGFVLCTSDNQDQLQCGTVHAHPFHRPLPLMMVNAEPVARGGYYANDRIQIVEDKNYDLHVLWRGPGDRNDRGPLHHAIIN